jgi:hypothetical protein
MFCDSGSPHKAANELKFEPEIDTIAVLTAAHSAKCQFVISEQQAGSS